MKHIWKKLAIACMAFATMIQLPGGGASFAAEDKTEDIQATITVASNTSQQDMQEYLDNFHKKYPNITVEYQYYSDYENEVMKQIEAGDYADVLFVPSSVPAADYAKDFELLGTKDELSKKYNYLDGGKILGNDIYGIPYSAYMNGIVYNKEVFDKAGITELPKSTDEFLEALHAIKERTDAIPFYTNYAAGWPLQVWETYPYIEMTGDPNYCENGFVNELNPFLEGTSHYQVYKLLYDIVQQGLCEEDPAASDWDASKTMLNEGKIGCMAIGSWAMYQVQNAGPNGDAIAYMPFPNEVDGKQYMTVMTDYCYAINKNSEEKEAARCYIDYMLDESGYALDHEVLSLVKADPILESYGDMDDVVCLSNNAASDANYNKRMALSANLNLRTDYTEIKRVIEAGIGERNESFDQIAEDWNERWESSRTEELMPTDTEKSVPVLSSIISTDYEIEISDTEQSYLDGLGTIRVGYLRNLAPYEYESENGYQGVSKALLDKAKEKLNFNIQEIGYDNTQELIDALKNGDIDMAAGVQKKTEYANDVKYSTDYVDCLNVIVMRKSDDMDKALKGTMAQIKGEYYSDYQTEASDTRETDDLADSLRAVANGKADFAIANYYSAYYYMQEQGITGLNTIPLAENGHFYLAFSKKVDTRMVSICNKLIYSVPDENLQVILNDSLQEGNRKITVRRFVQENKKLCILVVNAILLVIIVLIVLFVKDRIRLARTDELTGLNNRHGLRARIGHIYEKKHTSMTFAIMDIDDFKRVNDTLGHAGGDEALKILATKLREVFGKNAVYGRYGGDEFVLCITRQTKQEAEAKIKTLVEEMEQTFTFDGDSVPLSISLGAVYTEELIAFEDLFQEADAVLYEVKKKGKNGYAVKEHE